MLCANRYILHGLEPATDASAVIAANTSSPLHALCARPVCCATRGSCAVLLCRAAFCLEVRWQYQGTWGQCWKQSTASNCMGALTGYVMHVQATAADARASADNTSLCLSGSTQLFKQHAAHAHTSQLHHAVSRSSIGLASVVATADQIAANYLRAGSMDARLAPAQPRVLCHHTRQAAARHPAAGVHLCRKHVAWQGSSTVQHDAPVPKSCGVSDVFE